MSEKQGVGSSILPLATRFSNTIELNHKKILRGLEDAKEGLEDMQSYFEEGFGKDYEDRVRAAANYAVGVSEVILIGIVWDCPTD